MNGDQVSTDELLEMRKDPFPTVHILNIKDDVGNCWHDLGIAIGIKTAIVRCIEKDYKTSRERAHRVLEKWIEQNGKEATVGRLACALIRIGQRSIADKLLDLRSIYAAESTQTNEREGEQSNQLSERAGEQTQEPSERAGEQSKQPSEQAGEQSEQPSERAGEQSQQPKEREGGQSKQPSERAGKQSNQPSEREGEQSKQVTEREGDQSKQVSEPEKPDDIFSLLAEVQELRKVVTGLESQPKQHEGEQAKQATRQEGEQSQQPSEYETGDDMFSLLAEIKELTKIAVERKRQKNEDETLK